LTPENFEKWAKDAGVSDMAKYKAGLAAHTWADKVDKDHDTAKKAGVNGTPGFYINGVSLAGAQPFDKFKTVIDQELQKAQAKIAAGTPKDKIYVTMSQENKKNAPPPAEEDEGEKEDTKTVFKVPAGDSPSLGPVTAPVTIIEFSDFQCPFCKRVEDTVKEVEKLYGEKLKIVWRNVPLPMHADAPMAAEAAMEAYKQKGAKGFWDMHGKLFANQQDLKREALEKYAGELSLDMTKFKSALDNHVHKAEVDADAKAANDAGISGTPAFVINGYFISGAQPLPKFKKIIDRALSEAH
jgi:protein-disulfide isomerase